LRHARFLLSLPLLLIAEMVTEQCMAPFLARLHRRKLVPEESLPKRAAALVSTRTMRESPVPEIVIVVLIYTVGLMYVSRHFSVVEVECICT
jgi:hypothetical protein